MWTDFPLNGFRHYGQGTKSREAEHASSLRVCSLAPLQGVRRPFHLGRGEAPRANPQESSLRRMRIQWLHLHQSSATRNTPETGGVKRAADNPREWPRGVARE